jgi:hypothetical protein
LGSETGSFSYGDLDSPDIPRLPHEMSPQLSARPSAAQLRRKFAPQLVETAKRTRKAGDTGPAVLPSDKTEAIPSPGPPKPRSKVIPTSPVSAGIYKSEDTRAILEARRLGIPIVPERTASRSSTRSHSFRVPELDPIESSQSEEENSSTPSLSTSPSAASDQSYMYKHGTRLAESVGGKSSSYLLQLAARTAERQLRDQALAAFPNDDHHEPVAHFIDGDGDETESMRSRKSDGSFTEINWELKEMQEHQRRLAERKERERKFGSGYALRRTRTPQGIGPWSNPAAALLSNWPKDREMARMRTGAKPPMLGEDIEFPRCRSPSNARFDVTQGSENLRNAMCYLTEQTQTDDHEGLWCFTKKEGDESSMRSSSSRSPSRAGGLWGGCCIHAEHSPKGRTGLLTPRIEVENISPNPTPQVTTITAAQTNLSVDMLSIDEKLQMELSIKDEFDDAFITQVYNYLSLGYPSIARDFDEELSKVARIPVSELRSDDQIIDRVGYIRLGEDESGAKAGIFEENCMRWRALRLYIHEWARQQPRMISQAHVLGGFGVHAAARKGSWAN